MSAVSVAISGGTGNIGGFISRAFLAKKEHFSPVVVFTRDANSRKAQDLAKLGAKLVTDPINATTLKGIDVYVNVQSHMSVKHEEMDAQAKAAAEAGVKVYFPSTYGGDSREGKIDIGHPLYDANRRHHELAKGLGLKTIAIVNGPIAYNIASFAAWIGLDLENRTLTVVGSPEHRVSWAAESDIANTVVCLSEMTGKDPKAVPDDVVISSETLSWTELVEMLGRQSGKKFAIKVVDKEEWRGKPSIVDRWAYLASTGVWDLSKENDNEFVNPEESLWKWKKLEDVVKETGLVA